MKTPSVFFAIALLATGCVSNQLRYVESGPAAPRPVRRPEDVRVHATPPQCGYSEIGIMEWSDAAAVWRKAIDEIVWEMRHAAAHRGADAIVLTNHADPGKHGEHHAVTAAAIQYREPCP